MAHVSVTPQSSVMSAGTLVALVLVGILGFAVGQSWPVDGTKGHQHIEPQVEDWHGNVRRSHWSE